MKKVEENENKIKELMESNSVEGISWADIMEVQEKRTVEDVLQKSLKKKDNGEKERLNRRNIIVFELPGSKKLEPEDRKEEDIKKFIGLFKSIIKITFDQCMIEHAIRL